MDGKSSRIQFLGYRNCGVVDRGQKSDQSTGKECPMEMTGTYYPSRSLYGKIVKQALSFTQRHELTRWGVARAG